MSDRSLMRLIKKWSLVVLLVAIAIKLVLMASDEPWATRHRRAVRLVDDQVVEARRSAEEFRRSASSSERMHARSPGRNPFTNDMGSPIDWKQAAKSAGEMAKVHDLLADQIEQGNSPRR